MATALKLLYNRAFIQSLSQQLQLSWSDFPSDLLQRLVFHKQWPQLELKARMHHIADSLHQCFNHDYLFALPHLQAAAPAFSGFEPMIFPDYVERFGLDHWQVSLRALALFTQYSSSEFAVRPFILKDQLRMLAQMQKWALHKNHHLRRLASEGCRPRLPWALALPEFKQNPQVILPILECLHRDSSDYVRRSVANNYNDISKDHPDLLLSIAKKHIGAHQHTDWIFKHACRSLLKSGNSQAMRIFGFVAPTAISVKQLNVTNPVLCIGESFEFTCCVSGPANKSVRLEYAIDYVKKNGSLSRKVFKISESDLSDGLKLVSKRHSCQQRSTRIHYPGLHHLHIIVNGEVKASASFTLKA